MPHSHQPLAGTHPTPVQRAVMNRQTQNRRCKPGSAARALRPQSSKSSSNQSPRLQPTPPSQIISPITTNSPVAVGKGMISPSMDMRAQQQQPQPPLEPRRFSQQPASLSIPSPGPSMPSMTPRTTDGTRSSEMASTARTTASFYPSPFQAHIEQLGKLSRPLLSVFLNRALFVLD